MSKPFKGPTWDDVLVILEEWEQGHGSPPEGWPPGFEPGPRSLADRLEDPPRLEPGPKPTVSNAIEARGGNN